MLADVRFDVPIHKLSPRQINLILFALRATQADFTFRPQPLQMEFDLDIIDEAEIDELCEAINCCGHVHIWRRG